MGAVSLKKIVFNRVDPVKGKCQEIQVASLTFITIHIVIVSK